MCSESGILQRPGSSEVEALSEKDQRQAAPLVDAFDITVVSYYIVSVCRPSVLADAARSTTGRQGGHKPGKPGILRDFSKHGKLREYSGNTVQPQGKIVTDKVFLVPHSNIWSECDGDLLYCWNLCEMTLDEGH